MWHELVLNGVGGATVEEAQWSMSHAEALNWMGFIQRRGTLNLGLRMEAGFALLAWLLCKGFKIKKEGGASFKLEEFAPHLGEFDLEEEEELTLLKAIKALGAK